MGPTRQFEFDERQFQRFPTICSLISSRCVGGFFGDLFGRLVYSIFKDLSGGGRMDSWMGVDPGSMRKSCTSKSSCEISRDLRCVRCTSTPATHRSKGLSRQTIMSFDCLRSSRLHGIPADVALAKGNSTRETSSGGKQCMSGEVSKYSKSYLSIHRLYFVPEDRRHVSKALRSKLVTCRGTVV